MTGPFIKAQVSQPIQSRKDALDIYTSAFTAGAHNHRHLRRRSMQRGRHEMEQATDVMNDLQGNLLSSSDRGGMHIEYARAKMRKQKKILITTKPHF